jgi:hypothetical protein
MSGPSQAGQTELPKAPPDSLSHLLGEHPDELIKIIRAVEEVIDHYESNREKHYRSVATAQAHTAAIIIGVTLGLVGLAVALSAFLAYKSVISGEAFTFVAGTVVGSLIAFMGYHIAPNLLTIEESEP